MFMVQVGAQTHKGQKRVSDPSELVRVVCRKPGFLCMCWDPNSWLYQQVVFTAEPSPTPNTVF